jgi:hypothetical protein
VRIGKDLAESGEQPHALCHACSIPFRVGKLPEKSFLQEGFNKVPSRGVRSAAPLRRDLSQEIFCALLKFIFRKEAVNQTPSEYCSLFSFELP